MERILISRREDNISHHMTNVENLKNRLQAISDEFKKFQIGNLSSDNIRKVLSDPEGYIRQQILNNVEAPQMAGFSLKKEVLLEQMELPSFTPIKQLAADAQRILEAHRNAPRMHAFEFDEEGNVSIWSGYEPEVTDAHSTYAETEVETGLWKALEKFREAWLQLDEYKHEHLGIKPDRHPETQVKPYDLLDIKRQFVLLKSKLKTLEGA